MEEARELVLTYFLDGWEKTKAAIEQDVVVHGTAVVEFCANRGFIHVPWENVIREAPAEPARKPLRKWRR